jgi:hypothetical protein
MQDIPSELWHLHKSPHCVATRKIDVGILDVKPSNLKNTITLQQLSRMTVFGTGRPRFNSGKGHTHIYIYIYIYIYIAATTYGLALGFSQFISVGTKVRILPRCKVARCKVARCECDHLMPRSRVLRA